jgi:hypothetical protein
MDAASDLAERKGIGMREAFLQRMQEVLREGDCFGVSEAEWRRRVEIFVAALQELFPATTPDMVIAIRMANFAQMVVSAAEAAALPVVQALRSLGDREGYYVPRTRHSVPQRYRKPGQPSSYEAPAMFCPSRLQIKLARELSPSGKG